MNQRVFHLISWYCNSIYTARTELTRTRNVQKHWNKWEIYLKHFQWLLLSNNTVKLDEGTLQLLLLLLVFTAVGSLSVDFGYNLLTLSSKSFLGRWCDANNCFCSWCEYQTWLKLGSLLQFSIPLQSDSRFSIIKYNCASGKNEHLLRSALTGFEGYFRVK